MPKWYRHIFCCCLVSLAKFSYWSKFHVNIITFSGVMTIFFYKRLIRNPEIGNTPVWVWPNIWRLGRVSDTKFVTNVSNEMLLNATKSQGYSYSFCRFWVIKGKPTWDVKLLPTSPTQIRVKPKLTHFIPMGCSLYIKNKLKSDIINDKKKFFCVIFKLKQHLAWMTTGKKQILQK